MSFTEKEKQLLDALKGTSTTTTSNGAPLVTASAQLNLLIGKMKEKLAELERDRSKLASATTDEEKQALSDGIAQLEIGLRSALKVKSALEEKVKQEKAKDPDDPVGNQE